MITKPLILTMIEKMRRRRRKMSQFTQLNHPHDFQKKQERRKLQWARAKRECQRL